MGLWGVAICQTKGRKKSPANERGGGKKRWGGKRLVIPLGKMRNGKTRKKEKDSSNRGASGGGGKSDQKGKE